MGLFDQFSSVKSQNETSLSPAESFAGILIVAIASDGHLANEEMSSLFDIFNRTKLFRSYPQDVIVKMLDRTVSLMKRQGVDSFLNLAISCLPHDLYETTFAIVTDLVLADGQVTKEEEAVLTTIASKLSLPQATLQKIIEVMVIKNKA
jgi:uncharacterized tellurite resistance protein B-like protein